ncbi:MAG: nucleotidyltransferase domain-containing protein [Chloroflexi bacterium]|nr:nucleotidyltransferase domain-containing protein [Chloroflexota bacterium]
MRTSYKYEEKLAQHQKIHSGKSISKRDVNEGQIERIARSCQRVLAKHYGHRLKGVVLYGSAAQNKMDEESDIDLLVLLRKPFDYFAELRRIIDLLYPVQLESDRLISAKPAAIDEFEAGAIQLYRNAKMDGHVI